MRLDVFSVWMILCFMTLTKLFYDTFIFNKSFHRREIKLMTYILTILSFI